MLVCAAQFIFDISKRLETLSNVSNNKVYGLSLIAEIEGYVGLFFGVSVNNITSLSLMEYLALKFQNM